MNRQPINPPYQRAAYEVRFSNVPPMTDEFIIHQDAALVVEAKLQYLKMGGFKGYPA